MESGRDLSSFWNFSDQLRLHTAGLDNLSLGDSIWSNTSFYSAGRRQEDRRNIGVAGSAVMPELGGAGGWKVGLEVPQKLAFTTNNAVRYNNTEISGDSLKNIKDSGSGKGVSNYNVGSKNYFNKAISRPEVGAKKGTGFNNESFGKGGKSKKNNSNSNKDNSNTSGNSVDKRFKTLPASEALPRNEAVGGYIFVCNNETMEENLKRQLFGLPSRYRDSVRAITPGLPIFLYNYSTHQLHGIFEAASFGGTNIDPTAWEDRKHLGESRFPAQVRVVTRKNFNPLEEDSFRPILHHYDGPKFRLELSVPEALALLDVFSDNTA
ncbi:B2 protein [Apostasia shenzhenica]|uniref:B2 protein n=1 Tax=Apostasia shenzhenica TaxID=1088818 RepID=A0A2I0AFT0_9ASPA|nr:B2 protein [Apostasia shenzhenica]